MLKVFKRWFNSLLRSFWGLIKFVFSGSVEFMLAQLKDIAIVVVTDLSKTDLTSSQKRQEAFKKIKRYVKEQGMNVKDSLINLAIELAVQYIKKKIND